MAYPIDDVFSPAPPPLAGCSLLSVPYQPSKLFLLKICCQDNVHCCHIIPLLFFFCTAIYNPLPVLYRHLCPVLPFPFINWKSLMSFFFLIVQLISLLLFFASEISLSIYVHSLLSFCQGEGGLYIRLYVNDWRS